MNCTVRFGHGQPILMLLLPGYAPISSMRFILYAPVKSRLNSTSAVRTTRVLSEASQPQFLIVPTFCCTEPPAPRLGGSAMPSRLPALVRLYQLKSAFTRLLN